MPISGNRLQQPAAQSLRHRRLKIQLLDRRPDCLRIALRPNDTPATRLAQVAYRRPLADWRKQPPSVSYLDPWRVADDRATIDILRYFVNGPDCSGYPSGRKIITGCNAGAMTVR